MITARERAVRREDRICAEKVALRLLLDEFPESLRLRARMLISTDLEECYRKAGLALPDWLVEEITDWTTRSFPRLFYGTPEDQQERAMLRFLDRLVAEHAAAEVEPPPWLRALVERWGR